MMTLAEIPSEVIPLTAIAGGVTVALVSIVVGGVGGALKTKQREQTKREVAAYVAEGSMTPDEAERLLKANAPDHGCKS